VHTKLPSAAALSSIEIPRGDSHADIENAFYGCKVPPGLSDYFTLNPMQNS
jgi:hypothetical protein